MVALQVLALTQGPVAAPSPRYRVYQLLPHLRQHNIEVTVSPALDDNTYRQLYQIGGGSRLAAFVTIWQKRRQDLQRLPEFDLVWIQKGALPGMSASIEQKIAARRPVVFDFDDAIWLPRQGGNRILRLSHRESTVQTILKCATAVIAGNEFLANYARQFNSQVTVVPSAVDTTRYRQNTGTITVGWIGSRSTLPYLKPLASVFQKLDITPRIIAAGTLDFPADFRAWQMETEVDELASLGIGVAPLPDNPWERGKCGVKILQYMASGLPVVAAPVGVQRELVRDGVTGFHATTPAEWHDRLRQLIDDAALRHRLGAAGRKLVTQDYDVSVAASRVAKILLANA